jgi:hypothetical protein
LKRDQPCLLKLLRTRVGTKIPNSSVTIST